MSEEADIRSPVRMRLILEAGKEDIVKELEHLKYNKRLQLVRMFEVLCESMPGFLDDYDDVEDVAMMFTVSSGKDIAVIKFKLEDLV